MDRVPVDRVPVDGVPVDGVPEDRVPEDGVPEDRVERRSAARRSGPLPWGRPSGARGTIRLVGPVVALLVGTLAVVGYGPAGTPAGPGVAGAAPVGVSVSHEGRWLVDGQGRVLMLRGLNYVPKEAPYSAAAAGFGAADADWLVANGFDAVRLGVLATGLMPTPGKISATYLNEVAKTVGLLSSRHIYVLLDMHQDGWGPLAPDGKALGSDGFPRWMTVTNGATNDPNATFPLYYIENPAIQQAFQSLWDNVRGPDGVRLQADVVRMFSALAKRFGSDPWLLGYDVFNEPWPGGDWSSCLTSPDGCPSLDRQYLDKLYASVDEAIRHDDRRHLVLGEPFVLFNFGQSATSISLPAGDTNSGMSFHMYPATPSGEEPVIQNALSWDRSTGGALVMTEWGATTDPADIVRQADELDAALMPWMYWSFDQGVVKDIQKPPRGNNLQTDLVDALVRPDAIAVAGTPTSQSYDPATHAYSLQWSTARPGGGRYRRGTMTTVSLPRRDYPEGYCARAAEATVISRRSSTTLTLVARTGATAAGVEVVPAGSC